MARMTPRMPLLPPPDWSPEAFEALGIMGEVARNLGANSHLGMLLANYPSMSRAFYTWGRHVLVDTSLDKRPRELATLRVAWRYRAEYEWHHHVRSAKRHGLTGAEIEATKGALDTSFWNGLDLHVLVATDQLCETGTIDRPTWDALAGFLDQRQMLDLLFTIGHYVMLSWVLSAVGVGIEPGFSVDEHRLT